MKKDSEHSDDVEFVDADEQGDEAGAKRKLAALKEKISLLEKEKQEYLDGWQRARADYANLLKSSDEDKRRLRGIVEETFLHELLPVVDSFDQARNNTTAWEAVDPTWRTGVEYIHQQLLNILKDHSLHAFGTAGDPFDPALYEAVSETETTDPTLDHTVASVLQRGYRLKESILRPARVSVYALKKV